MYLPYNEICPNKICYSYNLANDLITHRDNGHLTKEGSELLSISFNEFLKSLNYFNLFFKYSILFLIVIPAK